MTEAELKEQVYAILRSRIGRSLDSSPLAKDPDTLQHAINIAFVNIAVLATNRSLETAIEYLYETQRKLLKGATRDKVTANVMDCLEHFRPELRVFREMHRMIDEGLDCDRIFARVQHLFDTNAKELEPDITNQPDPFPGEWPFGDGPDDPDEEAFIRRVTSRDEPKRKQRKA